MNKLKKIIEILFSTFISRPLPKEIKTLKDVEDEKKHNNGMAYKALNCDDWELFLIYHNSENFTLQRFAIKELIERNNLELLKKYTSITPKAHLSELLNLVLWEAVKRDNFNVFQWGAQQCLDCNHRARRESYGDTWRDLSIYIFSGAEHPLKMKKLHPPLEIAKHYILNEKTDVYWLMEQKQDHWGVDTLEIIQAIIDKDNLSGGVEHNPLGPGRRSAGALKI